MTVIHQPRRQVNKFVPRRPVLLPSPLSAGSGSAREKREREREGRDTTPTHPSPLYPTPIWLFLLPHHYFMQWRPGEQRYAGGERIRLEQFQDPLAACDCVDCMMTTEKIQTLTGWIIVCRLLQKRYKSI